MRKLLPILILSALFVSCAQEVLEPEQQISGLFALYDESWLVSDYVSFENGRWSQYSTMGTLYPFAEGKIWHTDVGRFRLMGKQNYSIRDGVFTTSGGVSGPIELKDGVLTIGSKRYVALEGFEEAPYSRIVAQNEYVFTYTDQDISIPFTVENPLPYQELTAGLQSYASGGTWITNLAVQEGKITAHLSATAEDRTGTIELSYTHAESVTVQIKQQPSTFITIPETSRTVDYTSSTQTLNYSIENPVATSTLRAYPSDSWVHNINISENQISFDVQENNTGADRNATLTLRYEGARDVTFNVLQRWSASSITLTPASKEVDYTGGTFTFNYSIVNPREGVSVTATSQSNWITNVQLTSSTISYKVAENNSGSQRTGKIKLTYGSYATVEFTVTQKWSASEIIITPSSTSMNYTGGSGTFTFSVQNPRDGATVTLASQADWITGMIVSDSKVDYTVAENNSGAQRTGKIKLTYGSFATAEFTVTQGWSASTIVLSPASTEMSYASGTGSFTFTIQNPRQGAAVTAESQIGWITDVQISGSTVSYKIDENNSGSQRTGKIKLTYGSYAAKEFIVIQTWSASEIVLTPASVEMDYKGGSGSFNFAVQNSREGATIKAASQVNWITDVQIAGTTVSYKVAENNSGAQRTGKVKLTYGSYATTEFTVTQAWSASEIVISPTSSEMDYTGGSGSFTYTVRNPRQGAAVTAESQADWITNVQVSGSDVSYKVAENNSGAQRTGKIRISYGSSTTYGSYAAKEFTVTQGWSASEIVLTPTSTTLNYTGGSGSFTFTVQNPRDGTSVSVENQSNWISGVTISGSSVSYSVAENNSGSQRVGVIKLSYGGYATKEFIITQTWAASVISLDPASVEMEYAGGSGSLIFTVQNPRQGATVTAESQTNWITGVSVSGTTVSYSVAQNDSGQARTGKIELKYGNYAISEFSVIQRGKPIQSLSLSKSKILLPVCGSDKLTATIIPEDAPVVWSSSNPSIVTVDQDGSVLAIKNGSTSISVSSTDGTISATCEISVLPYVDLGLSVCWAFYNIGASQPSGYGYYYAWGETSTKSSYSESNYSYRGSSSLPSSADVASVKLGGNWRMPTKAEFDELKSNCSIKWTQYEGTYGRLFTSKINGNSIFLPAAGYKDGSSRYNAGSGALYWSSSSINSSSAWCLDFFSSDIYTNNELRYRGCSIRPVYDIKSNVSPIDYEEGGKE